MNLSKDVRILLERALRFARKNRYIYLTPEMLLLILLEEESFREAVDLCGGDIDALIKDLKGYLEEYVDRGNGKNPEISEALSEALNMAGQSAYNSGNREIMTRHLIHGMFGLKNSYAVYYLKKQGVEETDLLQESLWRLPWPLPIRGEKSGAIRP